MKIYRHDSNKGLIQRNKYRGVDKSLVRTDRKQATATEDFDVYISYLLS